MSHSAPLSSRVCLYGGTFDPIHFGHLISARSVAEQIGADRVMLIPAARPPHKTSRRLAGAEHRMRMVQLAIDGDPLFEASDVEINRAGPSYTIDTVETVRRQRGPDVELFWIIGSDSLTELANWHRISELVDLVTIVTATRPGWACPDLSTLMSRIGEDRVNRLRSRWLSTPLIDISATDLRKRAAEGQPIRYLTPDAVVAHIDQNRLYRE